MVHDPTALREVLLVAAPPDVPVLCRPMFGGIMAYADGQPFASLSDIGLALKFGGGAFAAVMAETGAVPLRYEPDQPLSKSYLVVPDAVRRDPHALRAWIVRSIASLPAAKPKPRRG